MKGKVACEKCIKAYKLPEKLLGKHKEKCYWCCAIIWDEKRYIKIAEKNLKRIRELGRKERARLTRETLKPLERSLTKHLQDFKKRQILEALEK